MLVHALGHGEACKTRRGRDPAGGTGGLAGGVPPPQGRRVAPWESSHREGWAGGLRVRVAVSDTKQPPSESGSAPRYQLSSPGLGLTWTRCEAVSRERVQPP